MAYTTINKSTDYFNTKLYTGNGATNAITGVGFQPDLVWIKNRSRVENHILYDAVRGATKRINANTTDDEDTKSNGVTAFDSDGFTVGSAGQSNYNGDALVSWNWKANGAGSANTDGSINSTVSVNTTSGFSIVKYVGTGSDGATVGHGLGVAPACIIIKNLDDSSQSSWAVYHQGSFVSQSDPNILYLNANSAVADDTNILGGSSVTINSTVFSLGDYNGVNGNTKNIIAYCFAEKTGYSKFGSYTGNGADQQFIATGFAPKFLLFKGISNTSNWILFDDQRLTYNATYGRDRMLFPVDNSAEQDNSSDGGVDMLSNGFCFRGTASMTGTTELNESGASYLYMAFGQSLVGSNNVPCTAR